ncbi:MAG: DUF4263 domain-containing protein [Chloroflexi bacterium]|nr:DUF4263 domain-containing protein [Chloroflexota bacterium]
MTDEYEFFVNKRPDRTYLSKAFPELVSYDPPEYRNLRILSKVFDSPVGYEFANVKHELILRKTPGGRFEVKAVFWDDSRGIRQLTFQRFTAETVNPHKIAFNLSEQEIESLFNILRLIKYIELDSGEKHRFDDNVFNEWLLSETEKRNFFLQHLDLVAEIAEQNLTKSDIVAIAYRKQQLQVFEQLLNDNRFFEDTMRQWNVRGAEAVWQRFFESNPWIFGYGLQYIFTSGLDDRQLEQVTSGHNLHQSGKRVDALVKTRGYISSLCFVEIKTHRTNLLSNESYRSECWRISNDLAGSVAQIQKTVQKAVRELHTKLEFTDGDGLPTGETAFLYQPKSYVVIGCLQEFVSNGRINEQRFGSFELFRRNITNPEIITFDELFERAKYIVMHSEPEKLRNGLPPEVPTTSPYEEDIPF